MFKINDYDLLTDYVMTNQVVTPPEAQTMYVEVPGRDGSLDLTDSLFGTRFNDREIKASFVSKKYDNEAFNLLLKKYQGRKIKLFLDDDYYFTGRLSFSSYGRIGNLGMFDVSVKANPYRLKRNKTTVTRNVAGTELIILHNERMLAVPTFETSANVQIKYKADSFSVNKGTHKLPIVLEEGNNEITIVGTATVTISYQEGVL